MDFDHFLLLGFFRISLEMWEFQNPSLFFTSCSKTTMWSKSITMPNMKLCKIEQSHYVYFFFLDELRKFTISDFLKQRAKKKNRVINMCPKCVCLGKSLMVNFLSSSEKKTLHITVILSKFSFQKKIIQNV